MDWTEILALASEDVPLDLTLTPLERNIALAVFSSLSVTDFTGFASSAEEQDARDAIDNISVKLMEAAE